MNKDAAPPLDILHVDVLIIGGGPAGLATAIHLLPPENRTSTPQVLILEKSATTGAHILSGAIIHPEPLQTLLTDAEYRSMPFSQTVVQDTFQALLTRKHSIRLPWVPPPMRMKNMPIVPLGDVTRKLAAIAEQRGAEIITSQTASEWVCNDETIVGVKSGDSIIYAPHIVLAEGAGGPLAEALHQKRPESRGQNPQTYAIGIKELWTIPPKPEMAGRIIHTFAHPLGWNTYGGGFIYYMDATHIALGLSIALDYTNPHLNPHDEFRRWKQHPAIHKHLRDGALQEYGAKIIPEGGWFSLWNENALPANLHLVGDAAGMVNTLELKGFHLAIQSGMHAAEQINSGNRAAPFRPPELQQIRNVRATFRFGLAGGIIGTGLSWLTRGRLPFGRIQIPNDRDSLKLRAESTVPKPEPTPTAADKTIEDDLFYAHLQANDESQPHIRIRTPSLCDKCGQQYASPCTRFCPAAVYDRAEATDTLHLHPSNCLQCHTCLHKCPYQNIQWETPAGGLGPTYRNM